MVESLLLSSILNKGEMVESLLLLLNKGEMIEYVLPKIPL